MTKMELVMMREPVGQLDSNSAHEFVSETFIENNFLKAEINI